MGLDQSDKHGFKHTDHGFRTQPFVFRYMVWTIQCRPDVSNTHQSTTLPPLLHPDSQLHLVKTGIHLDLLVRAFSGTSLWRHFYLRPLRLRVHHYGDNDPAADQVLVHLQVEARGRTQRRLHRCLRHPCQPGLNLTHNFLKATKYKKLGCLKLKQSILFVK